MKQEVKISPKTAFLENSKRAGVHQDTVMAPAFLAAVDAALLEYVVGLDTTSPLTAPKIAGAKGVLHELLNLGFERAPQKKGGVDDELDPVM